MVVCKIEAQLECAHVAYTVLHVWAPDLYAQSVLHDKISASELRKKFIVGWVVVDSRHNFEGKVGGEGRK